jgi:hypothetical protein
MDIDEPGAACNAQVARMTVGIEGLAPFTLPLHTVVPSVTGMPFFTLVPIGAYGGRRGMPLHSTEKVI